MNEELMKEFEATTAELLKAIGSFKQEDFNKIPFEGSWTAAQVTEHLFKSEKGLPRVLQSNTKPADRRPDEKVPIIKSIFLDYSVKMQSPDFIIPSEEPHQKEEFLQSFEKLRAEITQLATTLDLSLVCVDYPFPQMGEFTRLEWLYFSICHSTRHTRQLKNIYSHFAAAQ